MTFEKIFIFQKMEEIEKFLEEAEELFKNPTKTILTDSGNFILPKDCFNSS